MGYLLYSFLIIVAESFGALALIVGLMARFSAAAISLIMLAAIFMVHFKHGFFMNWFCSQQGEGYEYHILAIGLGLVVVPVGAGENSIDLALSKHTQ